MSAIPSFILRKLYVTGSLCNTAEGCQFQIKNTLAPVLITGVGAVTIDGAAHPATDVALMRGKERVAASAASKERPVSFDVNTVVTILVKGLALSDGEHRIVLEVTSREAGRLKVDIVDTLNA